jgi:hypothetical protein
MADRDISRTEPDLKARPQGVNVDDDPIGLPDGALRSAQNFLRLNDQGGIRKRAGLELFVDIGAVGVIGLINVALVPPPLTDPDTGVEQPEGDPMYARLYKSGNAAIANNTLTLVTFDTEDFDVGALHDGGVNPSRLTIPADGDGLWALTCQASWQGRNATGGRTGCYIYKNGVTRVGIAEETPDLGAGDGNLGTSYSAFALQLAVAGDYFEMQVQQNSGGALNLLGIAADLTSFAAFRIRATV